MNNKWKKILATLAAIAAIIGAVNWWITPGGMTTHSNGTYTVRTFSVPYNDSHLLIHGDNALLIDSGLEADAEKLDVAIRQSGFDPANISAIVLTHGHADHAGGAKYFQDKYNTKIIAGAGDVHMLESGVNDAICPTDFMSRMRAKADQAVIYTPTEPQIIVSDPMNLKTLTGIDATITPLESHTPGSLIITAGDLAFVGDLFRGSMIGKKAVTHFYICDLDKNAESIRILLDRIAPSASVFFTGHFSHVSRKSLVTLSIANSERRENR